MTDPIVLSAENDTLRQELSRALYRISELESSWNPREIQTGKNQDEAFLARVYLEIDKVSTLLGQVVSHVKGRVDGLDTDVAQSQAFEKRAVDAFNAIAETQREHGRILRSIEANQSLIIQEMRHQGERITALEHERFPTMFELSNAE